MKILGMPTMLSKHYIFKNINNPPSKGGKTLVRIAVLFTGFPVSSVSSLVEPLRMYWTWLRMGGTKALS